MGLKPRTAPLSTARMIAAAMAPDDRRARFDAAVAGAAGLAERSRETRERHDELFGWLPAPEIDEYAAAMAGRAEVGTPSDAWEIEGVLPAALPDDIGAIWRGFDGAMWLLCGLVPIGRNPWGDTAWCSTIPSPIGTAPVYFYDHEVGQIDGVAGCSLGVFALEAWADREAVDPEVARWWGEIERRFEAAESPPWRDPKALFARSRWLLGFANGRAGHGFAGDLCNAPAMADWRTERERVDEAPWLANYWLLAHFYLDNRRAVAELVDRAANSRAELTRRLAWAIDNALADTSAGLLSVSAEQVAELRAGCARNALPGQREATEQRDGEAGGVAVARAALAAGADPWALIADHPDDVEVHDAALEHLAAGGGAIADQVRAYFRERTDEHYNAWPYDFQLADLDRRLSPAIAAAFRSGLRYDADHRRAFAGLTQAVGKLDDDFSMAAYREAVETLPIDDDRLEYVFSWLEKSDHPDAPAVAARAAWRCFEMLDAARANRARRADDQERDGVTLDNMFDTVNHLLSGLRLVLEESDSEAVRVAERILAGRRDFELFGRRYGDALRVAGERGLVKYAPAAFELIAAFAAIEPSGPESFVEAVTLANAGEAFIAAARLDRERAAREARALFDRETAAPRFDIDVKAAAIGALLFAEGETAELTYWVQRLLGNRTNSARLIPVLRAVAAAGLESAADWVEYHAYSSKNPLLGKDGAIGACARRTAEALGRDLPPFDDTDEYASQVGRGDLVAALSRPQRYRASNVLEKMAQKKVHSPEAIAAVARFAADQVRYSADQHLHESGDAAQALKTLSSAGELGVGALAELLSLPHLAPSMPTEILLSMRVGAPEAPRWIAAATMPEERALAALAEPAPRWLAWLDLLAARVCLDGGDGAAAAIEAAIRWRYARTGDHYNDIDPMLHHLPAIAARAGVSADALAGLDAPGARDARARASLDAAVAAARAGAQIPGPRPLPATLTSTRKSGSWTMRLEIEPGSLTARGSGFYCNTLRANRFSSEAAIESPAIAETIARMAAIAGFA